MRLVRFDFNKISIERIKDSYKGVKINSKINISEIKILNPDTQDDAALQIDFAYHVTYSPDVANIDLRGRIILIAKKQEAEDIIDRWKTKKMTEEFRITLFNIILKKANVKALELEEQIGLPLHIPLPTIKKPKEESKKNI